MKKTILLSGLFVSLFISGVQSQYNKAARQNVIQEEVSVEVYDESTESYKVVKELREVDSDVFGNAEGNQYDLAVDGAFEGQTIAVLHLYTGEGFDFRLPTEALKEDRKSTRLNSSHVRISYAVFCLKKKK